MNYVSIDIETTGLNPDRCQVLQVGAVLDGDTYKDTTVAGLPSFTVYLKYPEGLFFGEPYALGLNAEILKKIDKGGHDVLFAHQAWAHFAEWLKGHGFNLVDKIVATGKNFASFDRQFLRRLWPNFEPLFHHRSIDPMHFYMKWSDAVPPNMQTCLERAGLNNVVTHDAVDDARQVCELLRVARWRQTSALLGGL